MGLLFKAGYQGACEDTAAEDMAAWAALIKLPGWSRVDKAAGLECGGMVSVSDIMRKSVVTVGPRTTLDKAAKIMTNNRVGSVVIVEKDKAIGIITTDNIVTSVARGHNLKNKRVKDVQRKTFVTARPEMSVMELAKLMVKGGAKRVPVVDSEGKLVGIVSDKELLITTPEMISVLSEKLKMKVESIANTAGTISGGCESCASYSDRLRNIGGEWLCEKCR